MKLSELQMVGNGIILIILLIGLSDGCSNTRIRESAKKETNEIYVGKGDTIYIRYGHGTAMFLVDRVDVKNKVFVGQQCNVLDIDIRDKCVLSFEDYLKYRPE